MAQSGGGWRAQNEWELINGFQGLIRVAHVDRL